MTDVSILLPVYNVPVEQLHQALASVGRQTIDLADVEVCVHDDGSADRFGRAYRDLPLESYGVDVVWSATAENRGLSAARNHAASNATGRYYALLDADDVLHPQALELARQALARNDHADLVYSDNVKFTWPDVDLYQFRKKHHYQRALTRWKGTAFDPMYQASFVLGLLAFRADLFDAIGGYTDSVTVGEDIDFLLRAHHHRDDPNFLHVPRVLYYRRHSEDSLSRRRQDDLRRLTRETMLEATREAGLEIDAIRYGERIDPYRVSHYVLETEEGRPIVPPYLERATGRLSPVYETGPSLEAEWRAHVRPDLVAFLRAKRWENRSRTAPRN